MSLIKDVNDMLRMPEVARFLRFEPNRAGFIKSPFKSEKTASCKLYDGLGKGFCDFSTGTSGDCIKFVSIDYIYKYLYINGYKRLAYWNGICWKELKREEEAK